MIAIRRVFHRFRREASPGPCLWICVWICLCLALYMVLTLGFASSASSEPAASDPTANPTHPHEAATSGKAPTVSLESVMERFAHSGGVAARFRETRQLTILSEPIESRGTLYFAPPDRLARHVTEPGEAKIVVRGDRVSFRDETGVQTLELGSSEVARAMVGNVMVLLRGDLEALRAQYEVGFEVTGQDWRLDLVPRDRVVRQLIERLRVDGRGNRLVRMESIETSGDVTITEFSDVEVGVDFSTGERADVFSVETHDPVDAAP